MARQVEKNRKYLKLLSQQYPTVQSVCTEIINLRAILNLPKGTEHFMSDLHGEYEAFQHIVNNCSGVIREKVDDVFQKTLTSKQRGELCTLIYYPQDKLDRVRGEMGEEELDEWYVIVLLQLLEVCKSVAVKYTRSKVRKALPPDFGYIIDELLHADYEESSQSLYYNKIMESIIALHNADDFIVALTTLIKRLAVDHLHIVGDIFDRGPRPDRILDILLDHHSVDIQWGNHDILWMGAAAGSDACVATVIANSASFGNLPVLEEGYGINLRSLALFAEKTYPDCGGFRPRLVEKDQLDQQDAVLVGKMYKAISVILFKLEGQLIRRRPEFGMEDRILLEQINFKKGTVNLYGTEFPLTDRVLPTCDAADPCRLTEEEARVMAELRGSFAGSRRLQRHVRFLYAKGGMYSRFNHNLLFHGCIPMDRDGSFTQVELFGDRASGRALMDQADRMARAAYFGKGKQKEHALDGVWYLWCGKDSPLFGRERMTTFERHFVADEDTWAERKNPYYQLIHSEEHCVRILEEFGLHRDLSHIVNGHVPVRAADGESPVKGGGRYIVIDGGFSKAYQPKTGIAGYTLIYNSHGMRLAAHTPFTGKVGSLEHNRDIHSVSHIFETLNQRMRVMDTDIGQDISERIYDLSLLLWVYRSDSPFLAEKTINEGN